MPRSLDREERLDQVTQAAWRVLARDGLAALSVRKVAAEAGLPPSSLRYVLPTQSGLREHAIEASVVRLEERLSAVDRTVPGWPRRLLLELVPLDAERRLEMEVFIALGVAALTDPTLRAARERCEASLRSACVDALRGLAAPDTQAGEAAPAGSDDLDTLAVLTHALLDGLALQIVHRGPDEDPAWAEAALDAHLAIIRGSRALPGQP